MPHGWMGCPCVFQRVHYILTKTPHRRTTLGLPMPRFVPGLLVGIVVGALLVTLLNSHGPVANLDTASDIQDDAIYQAQPTSFWLAQLRDRDAAYRQKALTALGEIGSRDAQVHRAIVAAL